MRIYSSCYEAASEIGRDLKEMGKEVHLQTMQDKNIKDDPDYITRELLPYVYAITDTGDKDELIKFYKGEDNFEKAIEWAQAEFTERIGGKKLNPGEAWKIREEVWKEFLHDGKFAYSYSERIGYKVERVISELKKHPSSRQGIINIWNDKDIDKLGKERVPCFPAKTKVIEKSGIKNIEAVKKDDFVLSHDGKYHKVIGCSIRNYKGKLISLLVSKYNIPVNCTPEHPIYCIEGIKLKRNNREKEGFIYEKILKGLKKGDITPTFTEAKNINGNHLLGFSFPDKIRDIGVVYSEKKIPLSKDFGILLGYYLAEGEILFDRRNGRNQPKGIRFNFGNTEDEYVKDVVNKFYKVFKIKKEKWAINEDKRFNTYRMMIFSNELAELFLIFGNHLAKNKNLPNDLLISNLSFQRGIIIGYFRGDGGFVKRNGNYRLSGGGISFNLINSLRILLFRLGIIPSLQRVDRKIDSPIKSIGKRRCVSYILTFSDNRFLKEIFGIVNKLPNGKNKVGILFKNIAFCPIRKIKIRKTKKIPVYNLEIEGSKSYNVVGFSVHNCSMFYQAIQRNNKLHLIYVIRSNDLYTHWCYDVWIAIQLQEYIAENLGLEVGTFYQFIVSLHTYAYHQKGVF